MLDCHKCQCQQWRIVADSMTLHVCALHYSGTVPVGRVLHYSGAVRTSHKLPGLGAAGVVLDHHWKTVWAVITSWYDVSLHRV